jgi:hypothetical protein
MGDVGEGSRGARTLGLALRYPLLMARVPASVWNALREPLQGKTSLSKVFWVYGVLGSVLVSVLGVGIDPGNQVATWIYTFLGLVFSVYVTVATYRCAGNCGSPALARFVRISTVVSVIVGVPLFAYLYFTGALNAALTTLNGDQ